MSFVNIRGTDHYYEWMTADGWRADPRHSHKPVLVFLHGWAGSTRYWESTAQALTDQFDCLLYDLRGFGRSLLPRPLPGAIDAIGYELSTYAEDLALLLEHLGIDQVYLNAHSTGGSIAVWFLNHWGDRVKKAILTCNGVFDYDERAFKAFHQFGGYVVAFRPKWLVHLPGCDRLFMARFLHQNIPSPMKRAFLEDFVMADYEAALGTVYTAVSQKAAIEMPQAFARLQVPTLLLSGQYDKIIPAELGRKAAELNGMVQHVVLEKTGHFPMLEEPEKYLKLVRAFLRESN